MLFRSIAIDGDRALKQVQYTLPSLILLDVMMPGTNGFETCRRLKASAATKDIPVIFMTALSDTADKINGFQLVRCIISQNLLKKRRYWPASTLTLNSEI